jgi:hypothetical protein
LTDLAITPAAPARNAARMPASVITGSPEAQMTGLRSRMPPMVVASRSLIASSTRACSSNVGASDCQQAASLLASAATPQDGDAADDNEADDDPRHDDHR